MPYVNIKITREGATAEQKKQLIAGVTQLLVDTLGKNPATTVVVIDEVETDNWGWVVRVLPTYEKPHNPARNSGKLVSFPTYIIKNLKRRFNTIDSSLASSETSLNHSHH